MESEPENLEHKMVLCKALAADQQYEEALELGLQIVQADRHGLGEKARQLMVDVFRQVRNLRDHGTTYPMLSKLTLLFFLLTRRLDL